MNVLMITTLATFAVAADETKVDIVNASPGNAPVTTAHAYESHVTLSIEADDGTLTPSGWSTRGSSPFSFTPGQGLIQGWTDGVLKMKEGERAHMHVPASLGYGANPQGSKGGAWYIPGNSNVRVCSLYSGAILSPT
jgi:hypothetical protein